jgi:hypothetical protein
MSARCQGVASNFLALNLANDIVHGNKDVPEARRVYGEAMKARQAGKPPQIMQKLLFEITAEGNADPDTAII